jgi:1,4-alpha-glucan branching enzyme
MFFQGTESLATASFTDPPAPLEEPAAHGLELRAFYKDVIRLRRNLDGGAVALQGAGVEILHRNDVNKVLAYRRTDATGNEAIVTLNFANKAYTEYDIGVADANPWRIRLTTDATKYGSDFTAGPTGMVSPKAGTKDGRPYTLPLVLGAYGAVILTR